MLTKQGSYHRRAPSQKAVPILAQARNAIESWIERNGENAEILRLLALTYEAMLNYEAAVQIIQKVIALSPQPRHGDLKRLAACREAGRMWDELLLSPSELRALGSFLRGKLLDAAPERSLRWTEIWLREKKPNEMSSIILSLQKLGYPTDYHILHNLVPG